MVGVMGSGRAMSGSTGSGRGMLGMMGRCQGCGQWSVGDVWSVGGFVEGLEHGLLHASPPFHGGTSGSSKHGCDLAAGQWRAFSIRLRWWCRHGTMAIQQARVDHHLSLMENTPHWPDPT